MCIKCRCRILHTCSECKLSSTINFQDTSSKNTDYIRYNYKRRTIKIAHLGLHTMYNVEYFNFKKRVSFIFSKREIVLNLANIAGWE